MHRVILGAGVVIMEGLTNLGALPNDAFRSTPRSTRPKGPKARPPASSPHSKLYFFGGGGGGGAGRFPDGGSPRPSLSGVGEPFSFDIDYPLPRIQHFGQSYFTMKRDQHPGPSTGYSFPF